MSHYSYPTSSRRGNETHFWTVRLPRYKTRPVSDFQYRYNGRYQVLYVYITAHHPSVSPSIVHPALQAFIHPYVSNCPSYHAFIHPYIIDPFPIKPWFLRVCSTSLLKTLWEKEKLLVTSNFSFSHNVFYLF